MNARSWLRWGFRVVLVLLVLLLGTGLTLRVYGQRRLTAAQGLSDQVFSGLDPDRCAPSVLASEDGATPLLRAGAAAWSASEQDVRFLGGLSVRPPSDWSEEERRRARALLAAEATALELFYRAGERRPDPLPVAPLREALDNSMTFLAFMRSGRILAVHTHLALQDEEYEQAAGSLAALAHLATSLERTNSLLSLLVAGGVEKLLHGALQPLVEDPETGAERLEHLATLVPNEDLFMRWRCVLQEEYTRIQQSAEQEQAGDDGSRPLPLRLFLHTLGPLFEAQMLDVFARLATAIDEPFGHDPAWITGRSRWRDGFIASMFVPNLTGATARVQHLMASRQLARTALALRVSALTSGEYPQDLSVIPGAGRPDPFTGDPLVYTLEGDGSATLSSHRMAELWNDPRVGGDVADIAPNTWRLSAPPPTTRR